MPEQWVALAEVAKPHGVRGEIKLKVYNLESDTLLSRPKVRLAFGDGSTQAIKLLSVRAVPGSLLVELGGVESREEAEALRGVQLEVLREALEPLEGDDEFYVQDLVGLEARLAGEPLGRVVDVFAYPTMDVLVIEQPRPPEPEEPRREPFKKHKRRRGPRKKKAPRLEVPMQGSYVGAIDLDAGTVEILTLEGLS